MNMIVFYRHDDFALQQGHLRIKESEQVLPFPRFANVVVHEKILLPQKS